MLILKEDRRKEQRIIMDEQTAKELWETLRDVWINPESKSLHKLLRQIMTIYPDIK